MAYYVNLFSPETYRAFTASDRSVTGFRERCMGVAAHVRPGDKLICYMTKLSRWVGVLEVTSTCFVDNTPVFVQANDPFVIRFRVDAKVWLAPENSLPISQDICWDHLSFTRDVPRGSSAWTGAIRRSLTQLTDEDGERLEAMLITLDVGGRQFPLSAADQRKLSPAIINSEDGPITVSVPDEDDAHGSDSTSEREHTQMQAELARIGEVMGFRIWLPQADRSRVLALWHPAEGVLLERLPLNYDLVTLRTIENIDVLWIKRNAIFRAFEVEHTTSVYSGLLRMADLMSLQPNMKIRIHIVAPLARREKVLQEITRPVFALMTGGPLWQACSYLSYDAVRALGGERNLAHMSDTVLETYEECAQEADF